MTRRPTLDVSVLRAVIAMQHELAAVGLDLKAVMQLITNSSAYQRSSAARPDRATIMRSMSSSFVWR